MSGKGHYAPCMKCSKGTPSSTGYCEDCRTGVCDCGKRFVSQRKLGEKKCITCRQNRLHHTRRLAQAEGVC